MTTGARAGMTAKDVDYDLGRELHHGSPAPKSSLQGPLWEIIYGTAATGRELSSWRETAPSFEGYLPLIPEMDQMVHRHIRHPYSHTSRAVYCFILPGRTAPRLHGKQDEQQFERILCPAAETPFSTGRVFNDPERADRFPEGPSGPSRRLFPGSSSENHLA